MPNEANREMEPRLIRLEAMLPRVEEHDERLCALEHKEIKMDVILERICCDVAEIKKDFKHLNKGTSQGQFSQKEKLIWELLRLLGITIAIIASLFGLREFLM